MYLYAGKPQVASHGPVWFGLVRLGLAWFGSGAFRHLPRPLVHTETYILRPKVHTYSGLHGDADTQKEK